MSVLIAPISDAEEVEIVFDSLEVQIILEIITIIDEEEGDYEVQFLEEILGVDHDGKFFPLKVDLGTGSNWFLCS